MIAIAFSFQDLPISLLFAASHLPSQVTAIEDFLQDEADADVDHWQAAVDRLRAQWMSAPSELSGVAELFRGPKKAPRVLLLCGRHIT